MRNMGNYIPYNYSDRRAKKRWTFHLYVLALEDGKYYVGLSKNVKDRFRRHSNGEGARWTCIYKPVKIVYDLELPYYSYNSARPVENQKTIELMKKYGIENVRGGEYCAVNQITLENNMGEKLCRQIKVAHYYTKTRNDNIEKEDSCQKKRKKKKEPERHWYLV